MLSFQSGLLFYSLAIFRLAGLMLGFQGSPEREGFGGSFSSLPSFRSRLGGLSLSDTGIASHPDRLPRR